MAWMAPDKAVEPLSLLVRRESTAEQVAGALRGLIIDGALSPGTHLREGPLSQQLGVSRNTVREALHILVGQGVVRREIHRGAYVAELDAEDVRDIFRVRRLVELAAVRELIAVGQDLGALERALAELVDAVQGGRGTDEVLDADLRFHQTLVELVHSDRLGALYTSMSTEMSVCLTLSTGVEVHGDRLIRELRALLNAMRKGDAEKAVAVLLQHLAAGERRLLARFDA
jgi:DNA-binding GntR family transcriptional regulator